MGVLHIIMALRRQKMYVGNNIKPGSNELPAVRLPIQRDKFKSRREPLPQIITSGWSWLTDKARAGPLRTFTVPCARRAFPIANPSRTLGLAILQGGHRKRPRPYRHPLLPGSLPPRAAGLNYGHLAARLTRIHRPRQDFGALEKFKRFKQ